MTLDLARALARVLDDLSPPPTGILIALSGGLDSCAMTTLARAWARERNVPISALHVDHAMRASSRQDADFCAELCARLDVMLDVVTLSPAPTSQATARSMRTAHLARAALERGADTVLTAHHQDDVLETALMNMTRGASTGGVSALAREVAPMAGVPEALGLRWCRPLLGCSRHEIERYWGERAHALDPTNETDDYRRNRVRHRVLPSLLEEPGARSGMLATIANLADEARALEARASSMSGHSGSFVTPLRIEIDLKALDAPSRLDAELAAHWRHVSRALPSTRAWARTQVTALTQMARGDGPDELDLPRAHASRRGRRMIIEALSGRGAPKRIAHELTLELGAPGEVRWFGGTLSWAEDELARPTSDPLEAHVMFDPDATYTLRGVQPGDRLDAGERSLELKELARSAGVHARERWRAPCVCEGGAPMWLVGVRRGVRADTRGSARGLVHMRWAPARAGRK